MTQRHIKAGFAKVDPAHLFDGLFVPTRGKKRGRLYVPPRPFGTSEISYQGFEQLGADDQSVMLAISAQLGIDGLMIDKDSGPIGQQLRLDLDFKGDDGRPLRTRKTTLRSILVDAGYTGESAESGKAYSNLRASLNRLGNAQIRETNKQTGWDYRCNLLSTHFNQKTGEVFVAANPRLTSAVFQGQHVKVSLLERSDLEGEVAKLLHCWLCSNVRLGYSLGNGNGITLDKIAPHVYGPKHAEASSKVRSVRRGKLADALDEIRDKTKELHQGYGWAIDRTSSGLVLVSRPKSIPTLWDCERPSEYDEIMSQPPY